MLETVPLLALSGFCSPNASMTAYGISHPAVIISSGELSISIAYSGKELLVTVQHNIPPFLPTIPCGVQLALPFNYLASLFILDHGRHGRSIRIRLISPNRVFKLAKYATAPAHRRCMLDEHAKPVLLYPWHQNDHFDLLGILQAREVVAQIPSSVSMEKLVDWGAKLKDLAATTDGAELQVLFENMDTGRVSQLQKTPATLQSRPVTENVSKTLTSCQSSLPKNRHEFRHHDSFCAIPHLASQPPSSRESYEHLASNSVGTKRVRSGSLSSPDHRCEADKYWKHRNRTPGANSMERYYRSETKPRHHLLTERRKRKGRGGRKRGSRDKERLDANEKPSKTMAAGTEDPGCKKGEREPGERYP